MQVISEEANNKINTKYLSRLTQYRLLPHLRIVFDWLYFNLLSFILALFGALKEEEKDKWVYVFDVFMMLFDINEFL